MNYTSLGCALLTVGLLLTSGCPKASKNSEPPGDGGGVSISCYTDVQFTCEENPSPTADQEQGLRVVCSSGSGAFAKPAACPPARFLGKCTIRADKEVKVRRYYTGPAVDIAYLQDFCVHTAQGIWSTTF